MLEENPSCMRFQVRDMTKRIFTMKEAEKGEG